MDFKMLIAFYALLVAILVMQYFLDKYYPLFEIADKILIEYLKIILGIGVLIFCSIDYPSSNSFFLFMYPPFILINIYKLNKLHRLKNNVVLFSLKDKLVIQSIQSLAFIGMAIGIFIANRNVQYIAAIPLLYVGYNIKKMVQLYHAEIKAES